MNYDLKPDVDTKSALISGTGWRGGAELFRMGWSFLVILALASKLSPQDFGLVGMTEVFVQFFNIFISLGFDNAIVQQQQMNNRILSSLFWLNVSMGILLMLLGVAVAPALSSFYREPLVGPVFAVLSLTFLLQSLSVVQRGLLGRRLAFRDLALVDVVATFFASVIALVVAWQGGTYWSLVVMQLLKHGLSTLGYWWQSDWRPELRMDWSASLSSIRFSGNLLMFNVLNFAATRSDMILIGRLLGPEQLGFYFLAQRLILQPVAQILQVIERTLYPVLANVQQDARRVGELFIKTIYVVLSSVSPFIVAAILIAPVLLPYQLGTQWAPAVPVFFVWGLAALQRILTTRAGLINLTMGRPDLQWKFQIISTPVVLGALLIGVRGGAFGVSVSYVAAQFLMSFLSLHLAFSLIELPIPAYFARFRWVFVALIVAASCGVVVGQLLKSTGLHPYAFTIVLGVLILLTYNLLLHRLDSQMRTLWQEGLQWFYRYKQRMWLS
jgi:O-antigen/teichoic acid export membrane protein